MTIKLAAGNGDILWLEHLGGTAGEDDLAWDIVIGPDDNPVITGQLLNGVDTPYFVTQKLANADGAEIWQTQTSGYANNTAVRSGWLALMDDGDVVLCNRVFGSYGYDVFLERYDAADGAVVWTTTYNGPTSGGDDPREMIRDADGNLLVVGVQDANWNYNYMVLKFDGSDGSLLWDADGYDGPGGGWWDVASCVTEGPSGEVIAAGLSDGSSTGTGWDYTIVAYDPDDGSELWFERYNGPAEDRSDEPRDVIVASSGQMYVTGYGYGVDTGKDMITLCYLLDTGSPVIDVPTFAGLTRAWPNPFNPRINLAYELPRDTVVRLAVYDLRGREVAVLADGPHSAGQYTVSWDGRAAGGHVVPAGVYLAIAESDGSAAAGRSCWQSSGSNREHPSVNDFSKCRSRTEG